MHKFTGFCTSPSTHSTLAPFVYDPFSASSMPPSFVIVLWFAGSQRPQPVAGGEHCLLRDDWVGRVALVLFLEKLDA